MMHEKRLYYKYVLDIGTQLQMKSLFFLLFICLTVCAPSFIIKGDQFIKDGEPFTYLGGSLHYFRVSFAFIII